MGKYKNKQIVNAKPKNEHMILNNFLRPLYIFPMLLGHQEALPKHLHHSWSQSIQFPENWHIWLKRGHDMTIGLTCLFSSSYLDPMLLVCQHLHYILCQSFDLHADTTASGGNKLFSPAYRRTLETEVSVTDVM